MIEFYGKTLHTFRANLHTHSRISDGVRTNYLWREREAAYRGVITPDCLVKCSGCGAEKLCEGGICHA